MLAISHRPSLSIDLTGPNEVWHIIDSDDERQLPPPPSRMANAAASVRQAAEYLIVVSDDERQVPPPPSVPPPSQMENAAAAAREAAELLCVLTGASPEVQSSGAQSAGSRKEPPVPSADSLKPTTPLKRRRIMPLATPEKEQDRPVAKGSRSRAMLRPVSYTPSLPPKRRCSVAAQKKMSQQLKRSDDYLSQLRLEARDKDYHADQLSEESSSSYSEDCPLS